MTEIFFATNRNGLPNSATPTDFGSSFSPEGLSELRFGMALVDGENYTLQVAPEQQGKEDDSVCGSDTVFGQIKTLMADNKKDTLVLIHGYDTSFKAALLGAAQMKENYAKGAQGYPGRDLNVVLFSWPSEGSKIYKAYGDDRHHAQASGLAVARAFLKFAEFLKTIEVPCGQKLFLLTHSMGNYVLRNAVQALRQQVKGALPQLFDHLFLMAADEDVDALEMEEKMFHLPELAKQVGVYYNNNDKALIISNLTKGNPDRLGHDGPLHPQTVQSKVTIIDVSRVIGTDLIGHGYCYDNDWVIWDVLQVMADYDPEEVKGRTYAPQKNCFRLNG